MYGLINSVVHSFQTRHFLYRKNIRKMKQRIRINERQLKQIVTECTDRILRENAFDNIKSGLRGFQGSYNSSKALGQANRNVRREIDTGDITTNTGIDQTFAKGIQYLTQRCNEVATQFRRNKGRSYDLMNLLDEISATSSDLADIIRKSGETGEVIDSYK